MCRGLYHNTWAAENGSIFVSAEQDGIALAEIDRCWRSLREDSSEDSVTGVCRTCEPALRQVQCVRSAEQALFL